MNVCRVMVVDDFPVVRQGLLRLLSTEPDIEIVADVGDTVEALAVVETTPIDVAIVDISLRGSRNGIELTRSLTRLSPRTRVIVLSMHEETLYAVRAFAAGARGYVMKSEPPEYLVAAIRKVNDGAVYAHPTLSNRLLCGIADSHARSGEYPVETLSDREMSVFELIGAGLGDDDIAERLELNERTVHAHRCRIRTKLDLATMAELRRFAREFYSS